MGEISQLEDIFEPILNNILVLKNDISACLQGNVSQEIEKNIIKHFDMFYYTMKYQMNEFKMEINSPTNNNVESMRMREELQKAEYIIQLQTLSSSISNKISGLVKRNHHSKI
ncbi:hypothetical protein Trydic_g21356 [Trypoxylus dichotomus]